LDPSPWTGIWDNCVHPENPGAFDPGSRNYGKVPDPTNSCNTKSPGGDLPSPHGEIITLPTLMEFVGGKTYTSLLFRMDGSVEAVTAKGVNSNVIAEDGLNWVVEIHNVDNGLRRIITISRNGRVTVDVPTS
jgi:hypothetical protein